MSKYNNKRVEADGYTFDSKAEFRYYTRLKEKLNNKEIQSFRLQPVYILQDSFKKRGKTYRKITYIADFEIIHNDHSIEIVDIKGLETETFKLKAKLFEYRYPDATLTLLKYVQKYGGFITVDEYKNKKKKEKNKT